MLKNEIEKNNQLNKRYKKKNPSQFGLTRDPSIKIEIIL
jgi:hypothetical protein